jgi:hypothetical protein
MKILFMVNRVMSVVINTPWACDVCVSPWMRACIVSPQPVIEGVEEHVKCVCGVVAHPF